MGSDCTHTCDVEHRHPSNVDTVVLIKLSTDSSPQTLTSDIMISEPSAIQTS